MMMSDKYHKFLKYGVDPKDQAKGIDVYVEPTQLTVEEVLEDD